MGVTNSRPIQQPTTQLNPNMSTITTNTSAKLSPGLPNGPSNFSSFQLPGVNSDSLKINVAGLQRCTSENLNSASINSCISNNISSYDKQATSYQNVNYVGPGHSIDVSGNVTFGPFGSALQHFDNVEEESFAKTQLSVYIVIIALYLYFMLIK